MLTKDSVRSRLERTDGGLSYTEFSYMLLAGLRFRASPRALRLRVAGRRQRPVGQHHGRHRPGPAAPRRAALRLHLPAVDQERRQRRWARPSRAPCGFRPRGPAPTSSTNIGSTSTTPTWAAACGSSPTWGETRSTPCLAEHRADPSRRDGPAAAGRRTDPAGPRRGGPAHGRAGDGNLLRRRDQRLDRRPTGRPSSPTCPARSCRASGCWDRACRSSTPWSRPGLCKNKSEARRMITQGGAYVNNRRVEGIETQLTAGQPGQRVDDDSSCRQEELRPAAVCVGKLFSRRACPPRWITGPRGGQACRLNVLVLAPSRQRGTLKETVSYVPTHPPALARRGDRCRADRVWAVGPLSGRAARAGVLPRGPAHRPAPCWKRGATACSSKRPPWPAP